MGYELSNPSDLAIVQQALGIGTIAAQSAENVTITGGSVTGITDLAVADGGTGASDASGARTALELQNADILGRTFVPSWTGAVARTLRSKIEDLSISPKDFGAVGDGTTDDAAAFQSALDYCATEGLTLRIPKGTYNILTALTVTLPNSALTSDDHFSVIGDGAGQVVLKFGGSGTCLTVAGPTWGSVGVNASLRLSGFSIDGQNYVRGGLKIDRVINYHVEDINIMQCGTAHELVDVVVGRYISCKFLFNYRGMYAEPGATAFIGNAGSPPNELAFLGCHFTNNREYGAWFKYSAPVSFFGGSFEGNGRSGEWTSIDKEDRWDIKITNGGHNGVVPLAMYNTHFESSGGTAGVWVEHDDYPATYLISGCDFNQNAYDFGSGAQYWDNDILFDTTGTKDARIVVHACGFNGVNGYTASSSRRVIAEGTVSGSLHKFCLSGNTYWSTTDAPSAALPREEYIYGSSADGEYWRYPDGKQVCIHTVTTGGSGTVTWTYPAAFSGAPNVTGSPITGGVPCYVTTGGNFQSQCGFWAFNSAGTATSSVSIYVTAVGNWY